MTATLPTALAYGTVTWTAVQPVADTTDPDALPDPVPVTGTVTFTPSASVLLAAGAPPVTVIAAPLTYTLADDGTLRDPAGNPGITLVATDSPGVTPTGWTWTVAYRLNNGLTRGSFSFALPGGETVDLTTVAPVSTSGGTPVIQGPPGPEGPQGDPGEIQADAVQSVTLRSPATRTADTSRLRVVSYQKQEPENSQNGGEGIWLDLADARAKNMLTWRLAFDAVTRLPLPGYQATADTDLHRIAWAGAHYYAQDQADYSAPTDVHGHWSIEVPDANLALRTRLEVPLIDATGHVGVDKTNIKTNLADLTVRCSGTDSTGAPQTHVLRVGGSASGNRDIEFSNDQETGAQAGVRWKLRTNNTAEAGGNVGGDFELRRYDDAGTYQGSALYVRRSDGSVALGRSISGTPALTSKLDVTSGLGAGVNGVGVLFTAAPTTGAAYSGETPAANPAGDRYLQAKVTAEATARFVQFFDGKMEWGPGSGSRDTNLYRSTADRLQTDDDLVARGFRVGSTVTAGGGVGVVAIGNATTAPTSNATGGGLLYAEGGALKWRGSSGTVTTIAPA